MTGPENGVEFPLPGVAPDSACVVAAAAAVVPGAGVLCDAAVPPAAPGVPSDVPVPSAPGVPLTAVPVRVPEARVGVPSPFSSSSPPPPQAASSASVTHRAAVAASPHFVT